MRIIAGKFKGSTLYFPNNKTIRPLKDRVRESIFNLLIHSNKLQFHFLKSNVLDLYSGTGSFGLECLSRESKNVYFVENGKETIKILKKNIENLKLKTEGYIFFKDVLNLLSVKNAFNSKFDLIFCDPPFKFVNVEKLLYLIFINNLLSKDGVIILHRNSKSVDKFPKQFKIIEKKIYGISTVYFGKISF